MKHYVILWHLHELYFWPSLFNIYGPRPKNGVLWLEAFPLMFISVQLSSRFWHSLSLQDCLHMTFFWQYCPSNTLGLVQKKWSQSVTWRSKNQSQNWCFGFIFLENRLINASKFNQEILPADVYLMNRLSYGQGQEKWGRLHFFWTRPLSNKGGQIAASDLGMGPLM